ncbi:MAG TPA: FCD domain-containing protein [Streptosporangiaceae bacterium]|nr:FCD domain-containing protein [Streptosporangiaceae bacterium]
MNWYDWSPYDREADTQGTERHADRGVELAERILTQAAGAGLGPGDRLPTERKLAIDLGVTRASVRYAFGIMEAAGHISREVGRGTYLRISPAAAGQGLYRGQVTPAGDGAGGPAGPGGAFAPADVMMVRRLLEPPAMPLAVAWATAADFDEMDRCLAGGDLAASYDEFELWDLALHRSIIAAAHSPLLNTLYSAIEVARHGHMWGDLKRRSASVERRTLYQADHHQIVAALKARHAGEAVKAMRDHLARVSDHLNATDPAAGSWQ